MADNPYSGAAEGFQAGFNNSVQAMGMKRMLMQQKVQNLIAGFKEMNDRLASPDWPMATKNQIVNSPAYRSTFKVLTGADLPAGIEWNSDYNQMAKKVNGILESKASWGDKRQAFLHTMNEVPGMSEKFKDTADFLKSAAGPAALSQVDVGGKTVSIQQNQGTGDTSVLNVPGMGPAVSTSQKALTAQQQMMAEHEAKVSALGSSLDKLQNYKTGWLGRLFEPKQLEQAINLEQTRAKGLMMEMGLNKTEINDAMAGKDVTNALKRVTDAFKVPGTPEAPAEMVPGGLPGMTVIPKAAAPAPMAPPPIAPVPAQPPVPLQSSALPMNPDMMGVGMG